MSDVGLSFSGNEKDLVQSVAKLEKANEDLRDQIRKLAKENREAANGAKQDAKTHESSLDGVINKVGMLAASYVSVQSAARMANDEIRAVQERQSKAGQAQISVASSQQDVIRNLSGESPEKISKFLADLQGISRATKVAQAPIFQAAAEAVSASGGDTRSSLASVEQAAKFLADKPEQIAQFAGSILDIQKVTGWEDAGANQGFMAAIGKLSRVADAEKQSRVIPKALVNQLTYGATAPEAAALFATLTTQSNETEGRQSATSSIRIAEQLRDFFDQLSVRGADSLQKIEEMPKDIAKQATTTAKAWKGFDVSQMTMGQRMEALWQAPELAQVFMRSASFEAGQKGVIESLLTNPSGAAAAAYRENLGKFPGFEQASQQGRDVMARRMLAPSEPTAMVDRAIQAATEEFQTRDTREGIAGVIRDRLPEILEAEGEGALAQKLSGIEFDLSSHLGQRQALETAAGMFETRASELDSPVSMPTHALFGPQGGPVIERDAPTPRDLQAAEILRGVAGTLTAILGQLEKIGDSTKTTAENSVKAAPAQDAAARFRPMTAPRGDRG